MKMLFLCAILMLGGWSLPSQVRAESFEVSELTIETFEVNSIVAVDDSTVLLSGFQKEDDFSYPELMLLDIEGTTIWSYVDTHRSGEIYRDAISASDGMVIALRSWGTEGDFVIELIDRKGESDWAVPIREARRLFPIDDGFIVDSHPSKDVSHLIKYDLHGDEVWRLDFEGNTNFDGIRSWGDAYVAYGNVSNNGICHGIVTIFDDEGSIHWSYSEECEVIFTSPTKEDECIVWAYSRNDGCQYFMAAISKDGLEWYKEYEPAEFQIGNDVFRSKSVHSIMQIGEDYLMAFELTYSSDILLRLTDASGDIIHEWVESSYGIGILYELKLINMGEEIYLIMYGKDEQYGDIATIIERGYILADVPNCLSVVPVSVD